MVFTQQQSHGMLGVQGDTDHTLAKDLQWNAMAETFA